MKQSTLAGVAGISNLLLIQARQQIALSFCLHSSVEDKFWKWVSMVKGMGFTVSVANAQLLPTYTPTYSAGVCLGHTCMPAMWKQTLIFANVRCSVTCVRSSTFQTCTSYLNILCLKSSYKCIKHEMCHLVSEPCVGGPLSLVRDKSSLPRRHSGLGMEIIVTCSCR